MNKLPTRDESSKREPADDRTKGTNDEELIEAGEEAVNPVSDPEESRTSVRAALTGDVKPSVVSTGYRDRGELIEPPDEMPELKSATSEEEPDEEKVGLDFGEPPPEVMEYARRVVGETEEVKCQALEELRDMIYERGECLPHRMDDEFLIRFLRARNFNVRHAHRLLVNYVNFKEEHPIIHKDVSPYDLSFIGAEDIMSVPNYKTDCGRRMMIFRLGNWDPRKSSVYDIFKATVIILELGMLEPFAQVLGGVVIFDFEGITMSHAWLVTPEIANMVMALMVSAFPMKTHAIHVVNQSWVFDAMFKIFKPLLDSQMQQRLFVHGRDMESLHRHISPCNLPKKYGGTREEMRYDKWFESLSKVPRAIRALQELGYILPEDVLNVLTH